MRLFGLEVSRRKSTLTAPDSRGGWWPIIREPFAGAWQRDLEWTVDTVLAHHAVYSCVTLIAGDIGKLRPKLVEQDADGIWSETTSPAFSPVLRKPNRYQNRIQFIEWWITSKLIRGNAYALKERDSRGVVRALHLLDPNRVQVLVAPDGAVFYELKRDHLAGLGGESVTVPAREIIHDRMNCVFHPLVGVSPLFSAGPTATLGLNIEKNSAAFFANASNPSGILSTPVAITPKRSEELSAMWNARYSAGGSGGVAILGDGMAFSPMRMKATDSQLIEQSKHTAETVCAAFHVPPFKLGIGAMPSHNNAELLNQIYYSDCLQSLIEQLELCLDEGLGLDEPKDGRQMGVELDLDALLRMDTATQIDALAKGVGAGMIAPNEGRRKLDLRPVKGGATPYLQQQNFSLAALDARDRAAPPEGLRPPALVAPPAPEPEPDSDPEERAALVGLFRKALAA